MECRGGLDTGKKRFPRNGAGQLKSKFILRFCRGDSLVLTLSTALNPIRPKSEYEESFPLARNQTLAVREQGKRFFLR